MTLETPQRLLETRRFAAELRKAMLRRHLAAGAIATALGCNVKHVQRMARADATPSLTMANRLAELLIWDGLATLGLALHTDTCLECGKATVADVGRRRYCNDLCNGAGWHRSQMAGHQRNLVIREHRARDVLEAVVAMCAECEPAGICVRVECPLRPVSPLPLRVGRSLEAPGHLTHATPGKRIRPVRVAQRRERNRDRMRLVRAAQ